MGRVINPDSAGKERNRLARLVVTAIRQLMQQNQVDTYTRDLVAFVILALRDISETIDPTVEAWEKRGYWIKADRYRMEWKWTETSGKKLEKAVFAEDWGLVAGTTAEIAGKLANVAELKRMPADTPWDGAWKRLVESPVDQESSHSH